MRSSFHLPLILLPLLLCACSMQARKDQTEVRDLYIRGLYSEALQRLEDSEIKSKEENRLLYLLQRGKLLRAQNRHFLAGQVFVEAGELVDRLYTKSVKEALLTSVANNNSETYYGRPYERSLLFYYQALSFLDIYQNGFILEKVEEKIKDKEGKEEVKTSFAQKKLSEQDRRRYLFKARASIVAWDSFYKELQRSSREGTTFDHDLFAKILGAKIHELINKRSDDQIALQLYKDAYKILHETGPAFKAFSPEAGLFTANLKGEKIENKDLKKIGERTAHFNDLNDFLKVKILRLTKKRRAYKFKSAVKELNPSPEALAKSKHKNNVTIILETGAVAELRGEEFSYNLRSAMENVEDPVAQAFIVGVGIPALTYFAMGPLGLAVSSQSANNKLYARHGAGELLAMEAGIEFEMPVIQEPSTPEGVELQIYRLEGNASEETKETLVQKTKMVLAGPVSDLAYQMNLERISAAFTERGARIALKHVLAIIAAFKTYEAVKRTSGEMIAKPAAFAQYVLAAKAIKESERADTRQWSVLPSEVFLAELRLRPGKYKVKAMNPGRPESLTDVGGFSVKSGRTSEIFSYILP